jgi:squalene cyclase
MMERVRARLLALQGADGGWGSTAGRPSNTEATALASMALARQAEGGRGLDWLAAHQRPDGSWPWTSEIDAPSWASSLAVLALADAGREPPAVENGVDWLLGQEGRSFDWRLRLREWLSGHQVIELDSTLTGWPWAAGTFSWIEPTAFALLALKVAGRPRRARYRIREAEKMIVDRECPGGGWNYGNRRVLDVDLEPYPDTTALALLGLQLAGADAAVDRAFQVLDRLVPETRSGLVLSLAALCRRAWGREATSLLHDAERRFEETGFLDETRVIALATLAAREPAALAVHGND